MENKRLNLKKEVKNNEKRFRGTDERRIDGLY